MKLHKDVTYKRSVDRFETLEEDFRKVHGDKYDYSLAVYEGTDKNIKIICPIHGVFEQSPSNHLRGMGCSKCSGMYAPTTKEWIEKARKVHGDRYDYSLVEYKTTHEKVKIICKEHGMFEQTASSHLRGQGCMKCLGYLSSTEEWIEKAKAVHGDKYDYSLVDYKYRKHLVKIICPIHGEFEQSTASHMQGNGCTKCGKRYVPSTKEFIEKVKTIHDDKYDYSLVEYKNMKTKVKIICPIHGVFEQQAGNHLGGQRCPSCAKEGGNFNYMFKPTILYYVKIEHENLDTVWKIGITTKSINERFRKDTKSGFKVTLLKSFNYESGELAYCKEKSLQRLYRAYKYKGEKILDSGNTELFTVDCWED